MDSYFLQGIYRGIVTATDDKDGRARYRVQVHTVHRATITRKELAAIKKKRKGFGGIVDRISGNFEQMFDQFGFEPPASEEDPPLQDSLPWAECAMPAGKLWGDVHHYEIGDLVWIMFEGGNPQLPVIVGGWLSQSMAIHDLMPDQINDYDRNRRNWVRQDSAGNALIMSEVPGDERTELVSGFARLMLSQIDHSVRIDTCGTTPIGAGLLEDDQAEDGDGGDIKQEYLDEEWWDGAFGVETGNISMRALTTIIASKDIVIEATSPSLFTDPQNTGDTDPEFSGYMALLSVWDTDVWARDTLNLGQYIDRRMELWPRAEDSSLGEDDNPFKDEEFDQTSQDNSRSVHQTRLANVTPLYLTLGQCLTRYSRAAGADSDAYAIGTRATFVGDRIGNKLFGVGYYEDEWTHRAIDTDEEPDPPNRLTRKVDIQGRDYVMLWSYKPDPEESHTGSFSPGSGNDPFSLGLVSKRPMGENDERLYKINHDFGHVGIHSGRYMEIAGRDRTWIGQWQNEDADENVQSVLTLIQSERVSIGATSGATDFPTDSRPTRHVEMWADEFIQIETEDFDKPTGTQQSREDGYDASASSAVRNGYHYDVYHTGNDQRFGDIMLWSWGRLTLGGKRGVRIMGIQQAVVTGSSRDGSNWRWEYTTNDFTKNAVKWDGWTDQQDGRTGKAYNLAEIINTTTGMLGIGATVEHIDDVPGTWELQPVPNGTVVTLFKIIWGTSTEQAEWWFTFPNAVDGEC